LAAELTNSVIALWEMTIGQARALLPISSWINTAASRLS
jgi:hypothetical protein